MGETPDGPAKANRPGPIYDTAMRRLIQGDPAAACRLLGVRLPAESSVLGATFAFDPVTADLLLRLAPGSLLHVEYERRARRDRGKVDLITRMIGYRYAIMRDYPEDHLQQHVLVIGEGRVRGFEELQRLGFALNLTITYLSEVDPAVILAEPSLAPLASLGQGRRQQRAEAFRQALQVIGDNGGPRVGDLVAIAITLAAVHLDRDTIRRAVEEAKMAVESVEDIFEIVKDTWLVKPALEKIHEQGLEQGREQGLEQGREQLLLALLRERFGPVEDAEAVAHRLAGWPDPSQALHAVTAATTITELLTSEPST